MADLYDVYDDQTAEENYKPLDEYSDLPEGEYPAILVDSGWLYTKKGDGRYIKMTFQVTAGDFKGRKIFDQLNLDNPSSQAVEIAKKTLGGICHAVGVQRPKQTEELYDKPLIIVMKLEKKPKPGYEARVKPVSYKPFEAGAVGPSPGAAKPKPTAAEASTPPWMAGSEEIPF